MAWIEGKGAIDAEKREPWLIVRHLASCPEAPQRGILRCIRNGGLNSVERVGTGALSDQRIEGVNRECLRAVVARPTGERLQHLFFAATLALCSQCEDGGDEGDEGEIEEVTAGHSGACHPNERYCDERPRKRDVSNPRVKADAAD